MTHGNRLYPGVMTEMRSGGTLGDLLASRRQHRFVGRASEVELFRIALESPEPPFALLHIHGPPGIGKTSLLDVFAGLAAEAGATVVRLDGRELVPSPQAVLEALGEVLDVPSGEGAIAAPSDGGRLVVLCDTYERLAPLDDWFRTRLLPRLPATALTVVAGRSAPGAAWRADPAWRELLRVVSLRNLSPSDSRQYLQDCGVDRTRHDQLVELAHGHPLGLSLLADVFVRGGEAADDPLTPDLVGTLLRRFVEIVPSGLHRRALEVCAVARVTTEGLLREVLGVEDAHEPFSWLRELSFTESGPEGVFPHDLARDALEADLRWRDADGYRRVFRAIRGHVNGRLRTRGATSNSARSPTPSTCSVDFPVCVSPLDWDVWGEHYPEPAAPATGTRSWTWSWRVKGRRRRRSRGDGGSSNRRASSWSAAMTAAVGGFLTLLDLTRASSEDIAADPGAGGGVGLRAAPGAAASDGDGHPVPVHHRPGRLPGSLADPQRHADPDDAALPGHLEPGLGLPRAGRAGAVGRVLRRRRAAASGRRRLLGGRAPLRAVRTRLPTGPRRTPCWSW